MLRKLTISFLLILPLMSMTARADLLFGMGQVNGLVGTNIEWAMERSSFYVMPGGHIASGGWDAPNDLRWIAGFRHRVDRGSTSTSGFFTGLIGGDLGWMSGRERLGLGGEIGYQWINRNLRWTVSSGVAALEEDKERDLDVTPQVVLGVSVSFRQ